MTRMYEFIADSGCEIESVKVNGVAHLLIMTLQVTFIPNTNITENKNIDVKHLHMLLKVGRL